MWKLTIPGHMENERWIPEHDTELGKLIQFLRDIIALLMIPVVVIGIIIIWFVWVLLYDFFIYEILPYFILIIFDIISIVMSIVEWATSIIMDFLKKYGL